LLPGLDELKGIIEDETGSGNNAPARSKTAPEGFAETTHMHLQIEKTLPVAKVVLHC
jgi:hypothetical protein